MPPSHTIRAMAIAAGSASAAGAAQLGIGYGLGVFSWLPTIHEVDEAAWLASLAWTVWISTNSVLIGAVAGGRAINTTVAMSSVARALWRCVLSLAASLGGLIVVALTALPARGAQRADTFAPHLIVGGYAIAGVLLGLFVALAAITFRPVAANALLTSGWLWLLAVVATVDTLAARGDGRVVQLGAWQVTSHGPWFQSIYLPGAALAAGAALVIGAFAAWPAAHRGSGPAAVALSGAAGPAIAAAAYLMAAPMLVDVRPEQLSAHLVAPYAVVAGLIGSSLVALLTRSRRSTVKRQPAPPRGDDDVSLNSAKPKLAASEPAPS